MLPSAAERERLLRIGRAEAATSLSFDFGVASIAGLGGLRCKATAIAALSPYFLPVTSLCRLTLPAAYQLIELVAGVKSRFDLALRQSHPNQETMSLSECWRGEATVFRRRPPYSGP